MNKMDKKLEEAIRKNPEKEYKILITTKDGADRNALNIGSANQLMENIYSATLKGSKIQSLAKNKLIESIESDEEMSIT